MALQLHILPNYDCQRFRAASGSTVAPIAPFGSVKIPPRIVDLKTGMTKIKVLCCSSRHGHFLLFIVSTEDADVEKRASVLLSCVLALFVNRTSQRECVGDFCFLLSRRFFLMYAETREMSRWSEIFHSGLLEGYR